MTPLHLVPVGGSTPEGRTQIRNYQKSDLSRNEEGFVLIMQY